MGLHIRVTWDDTVIDERDFWCSEVRVGAGRRADFVAPGSLGRYVTFRRRGARFELELEPGAADRIELVGEESVDLRPVVGPYRRVLDPWVAGGRLEMGRAVVEFSRTGVIKEARDRALVAWGMAAAILSVFAGGTYKLAHVFGDGHRRDWERPSALSRDSATALRVRIGPDGKGSSRPQAGLGNELKSRSDAPVAPPVAAKATKVTGVEAASPDDVVRQLHAAAPKRQRAPKPRREVLAGINAAPDAVEGDKVVVNSDVRSRLPAPRAKVIDAAQAALLAADLTDAVDSFSKASETGELTYDQQNMLGFAHYLKHSLDDAQTAWQKAREMDASRSDAVNNLASVAKRRGDTAAEIALLEEALEIRPGECHALNSLALAQAKLGQRAEAEKTLEASDAACGGNYAYTAIQKAAMQSLAGQRDEALKTLEEGLGKIDTLIPIKEYEVHADLTLDPAFASLRGDARFAGLLDRFLPRAVKQAAEEAKAAGAAVPPASETINPFATLVE